MKTNRSLKSSIKTHAKELSSSAIVCDDEIFAVKDDLLALGIDVDYDVIGRMQKLGLNQTWTTASKAANSMRKRNPFGIPSTVLYKNHGDDKAIHPSNFKVDNEFVLEWSEIDMLRINGIQQKILSEDNYTPACTKISVQNLLQIFRIQYARSSEKFIENMLNQKNKKVLTLCHFKKLLFSLRFM